MAVYLKEGKENMYRHDEWVKREKRIDFMIDLTAIVIAFIIMAVGAYYLSMFAILWTVDHLGSKVIM